MCHFTRLKWRCLIPVSHLYIGEKHADDEVAGPVAAACQCNCCWTGPLAEELSHNEPWDRSGPDLKEADKKEYGCHANNAHPRVCVLRKQVDGGIKHSMQRIRWWRLDRAEPAFNFIFFCTLWPKEVWLSRLISNIPSQILKVKTIQHCWTKNIDTNNV